MTTSLKTESTKSTLDDPTRTTETVADDGTQAKVGLPSNDVTSDELVSAPGAKKAVWQNREI
jgi:hypothetical protein